MKAAIRRSKETHSESQAMQKKQYDRRHHKPEIFKLGSIVLKKDLLQKKRAQGKLDTKWVGPYRIIKSLGRGLYGLQLVHDSSKVLSRVNGVHLKQYNFSQSCSLSANQANIILTMTVIPIFAPVIVIAVTVILSLLPRTHK